MVELIQAHECEKCHLVDEHCGCRNGGGDTEDEAAWVEEGLVAPQGESNLLREGGVDRVVCRGGEGNVESCHLSHGKDDTPSVFEGIPVTSGLTYDCAKPGLDRPLADFREGKALSEPFKDGGVHCWVLASRLVEILDGARHQDQTPYGCLCRLQLKVRLAYAIVVSGDVSCNKEGSACLPFGVSSYGFFP